jgi:hypothetical protein
MWPLDEDEWRFFKGGYRYLEGVAGLKQLLEGDTRDEVWTALRRDVYDQGDVHFGSYASVPWLLEYARRSPRLDSHVFEIVSMIELVRPYNHPVPQEIADDYFQAIRDIPQLVGTHPDQEWSESLVHCAIACIALARGQHDLAEIYTEMSPKQMREWVEARDELTSWILRS